MLPLADLFRKKYGMQAGNIVGTGTYKPDYIPPDGDGLTANATPFWMVAGSGVEIEVDTETGHVRILRLINVADVGKPINPKIVETQLSGAALMQLGFTMFEKMHLDGGQVTNASLADYKIPGIHDVPPGWKTRRSTPIRATARSAPRASASSPPSASRRRSPMPSTTPSACGSPNCRSTAEAVLRALARQGQQAARG